MSQSALLIGAETFGLTGVRNDVEAMAMRLERRRFVVRRQLGGDATRSAILDGLERLVRDARESDTVVVYFSGHGGLVMPPLALTDRRNPIPRLQFLAPTDYDVEPGAFRGISTAELSVFMARLTRKTSNVAVIVDACHAANMVRDDGVRVKALRRPAYLDVVDHLDRLRLDTSLLDSLGNPHVVRLAACQRDRAAYEYTNAAGHRVGVFTEALTAELDKAHDDRDTWADLARRVRGRIQATGLAQRPEAEGPSQRLLFQSLAGHRDERDPSPPIRFQRHLGADVAIEWGQVIHGEPRPLRMTGATLRTDDHLYVRVRNDSRATVYVAVVETDQANRASLVTTLDPSGAAVLPGETYAVGRNELTGRWTGIPLERELGETPQTVTFAVVVSSAPRDQIPPAGRFREITVAASPVLSDIHPIEVLLLPAASRSNIE